MVAFRRRSKEQLLIESLEPFRAFLGPAETDVARILERAMYLTEDEASQLAEDFAWANTWEFKALRRRMGRLAEQHGVTRMLVAINDLALTAVRQQHLNGWWHLDAVSIAAEATAMRTKLSKREYRTLAGAWLALERKR